MDQEESTNTKFLCLFFMEDRSLSVLSQNDKNLTISELTEGSNCSMKWMGRKEYKCKIVKIHDNKDFLDKWASKVNNSVLKKHADSKDLEVSHLINEILNFKEASSSGKRKRIETTRSKESKIQDEEISPKKKKTASVKEKSEEESPLKKRNVTEKEEMDHPKKKKNTKEKEKASPQKQENLKKKDTQIAPAKKSVDSLERKKQTKEQFKKKVEATAAASMSMEIVSMASQFSIDKDTTSPSAPTATEMETEKTELNLVKSPLKSTCTTSHQSAPENEKEPTLNLAATYINLDSNQQTVSTPLTETWGLCQRSQEGFEMHQTFALSNDSFRLPATNMTNGIIPVPSPQVLETMRGIMHPDFQTYIREVLNHYGQNQNYSSHQVIIFHKSDF
ncbi:uncharacterized protein LOC134246295 [Saccostrea cucullata]|uniref:uncharacterized protein LOC134246295 n=1 Tax=Saccostrea cuccullata TaxID=36930 RepID=UPI002ED57C64